MRVFYTTFKSTKRVMGYNTKYRIEDSYRRSDYDVECANVNVYERSQLTPMEQYREMLKNPAYDRVAA